MARQEARHRLMKKILKRREQLAEAAGRHNKKRQRTSPSDHYHISHYPKASYDLTAWLSELDNDPATQVCALIVLISFLIYCEVEFYSTFKRPYSRPPSRDQILR